MSWVFLIWPVFGDASLRTIDRVVTVAYPAGDLLLLAMAVRLFLVPGGRSRAHTLFGFGLLAVLVADIIYAAVTLAGSTVIPQSVLDLGWLAGYALVAISVLDPTIASLSEPGPRREQLTGRRLWLLAAASLLAPATIAVQTLTGGDGHPLLIAATSAALFGLVVLRMAGLVRRVQEQATELARVARTDALTGAPNRRAWDEQLTVELARAARDGAPVSVALLDLDHFKAFNDLRGHRAGDRLLREAAAAWQNRMRTHRRPRPLRRRGVRADPSGLPPRHRRRDRGPPARAHARGRDLLGRCRRVGRGRDGRRASSPARTAPCTPPSTAAATAPCSPGPTPRPAPASSRPSGRRHPVDEAQGRVRLGHGGEDERRDAGGGERPQALALLVGVAEDEDLANQLVGHELERAAAVARLPGLDHRVEPLAPPQPAEERGVDRDGRRRRRT